MSPTEPSNDHHEQVFATQIASPEAVITIHQDGGNRGRVMFSLDLSNDGRDPDEMVELPVCDVVALTMFNVALRQSVEFNNTYNAVIACITELSDATEAGADADALRAIRERHGIQFRVG